MLRLSWFLLFLILIGGCSQAPKGNVIPVAYENDLGMEFVQIPAGSVLLGSADKSISPVRPLVKVDTFAMMKFEVTRGQFAVFDKSIKVTSENEHHPIVNVKRSDVIRFIDWLNSRGDTVYALPTEVQWEYGARGGLKNVDYPWGNEWVDGAASIGRDELQKVGSFSPNKFGLYDMCGNATEMCRNRDFEYEAGEFVNLTGPIKEPDLENPYVIRGIGVGEFWPWVWYRAREYEDLWPFETTGFRLVIETKGKRIDRSLD